MSPKFVLILGLLFALSLAVLADTSNDAYSAPTKTEATTDAVQPQQSCGRGCRHGCCGACAFGRCSACCGAPTETTATTTEKVEPQQLGRCGCIRRCCGRCMHGHCSRCCF